MKNNTVSYFLQILFLSISDRIAPTFGFCSSYKKIREMNVGDIRLSFSKINANKWYIQYEPCLSFVERR